MKYTCHVSGGAASAVCWLRALDRYGECAAVFADTMSEDPDLYRFLDDLETHTGRQIVRLSTGEDIWATFRKHAAFTTGSGCLASWRLKYLQLRDWMAANYDPADTTILIGMGPDEEDRQVRVRKRCEPFAVDFPVCWEPRLWSCDVQEFLKRRGLTLPALYDKGYPHNNCGGACIMAGIAQWCGVLKDYPERFAHAEDEEQRMLAVIEERGRNAWTILKDRRGGVHKTYSLKQLREDVEAGRRLPDDKWRAKSCSCMFAWGED